MGLIRPGIHHRRRMLWRNDGFIDPAVRMAIDHTIGDIQRINVLKIIDYFLNGRLVSQAPHGMFNAILGRELGIRRGGRDAVEPAFEFCRALIVLGTSTQKEIWHA